MAKDTLTITDNRTGTTFEVSINDETIHAPDLRQIKANPGEFGIMSYDPAFMNTASCRSAITYIDGDKGILEYRGYPIEQLCERSSFLEVSYLLVYGELPNKQQYEEWTSQITRHATVHEDIKKFLDGFRHDAHPMSVLLSSVGWLSTYYPEARQVHNKQLRELQAYRLIAKMPTLAAFAYRHSLSQPYVYPDPDLSFTGNFLSMMYRTSESKYKPNPVLEHALDVLFILHADHEQNAGTNAVRSVASTEADPYSAVAGGIGALSGPAHGGANEEVLKMLREIGSVDRVPEFLRGVETGHRRLMGFGHRVYKNYDPRARYIKRAADAVFQVTGVNPLLEVALELERIALEDEYFAKRKLYPNVDFYSGLIYEAMGLPSDIFTVLFAIARTSGWVAQWHEMMEDPEQKIARPRQIFTGHARREYVPMEDRSRAQAATPV
ncbi:MAG: citrate synthase [Dehalococcoidia bacterium]